MRLTFEKGTAGLSLCLGISLAFGMAFATNAQNKQTDKTDCSKAPKLIFQPKLAPEDVVRLKSDHLVGRVAVLVNESGSVTDVRVLSANPKEGAQILFDAVMTTKFATRHGCKPLNVEFIFELRDK